jgi:hypothetical protein
MRADVLEKMKDLVAEHKFSLAAYYDGRALHNGKGGADAGTISQVQGRGGTERGGTERGGTIPAGGGICAGGGSIRKERRITIAAQPTTERGAMMLGLSRR